MLELSREARQQAALLDREALQGAGFAALEAEGGLRQGDLAGAARWAEAAELAPTDSPHHWSEPVYFTYVRLLLAQRRAEDARTLLATIERSARRGGRNRKLITVYLQLALVEQTSGHVEQALTRVEEALRLAAAEDYRRAFLNEGQAIAALLPRARHVAPAFVDDLLDAFDADRRSSADRSRSGDRPRSALVEPLTEREQEILRLIAAGRSNPEIAERLYLSLNTIKWHVKNLYGKLDVSSRIEAVAHAQELGLL
jgi:LuxR family maltose regulon positive regulatory protein